MNTLLNALQEGRLFELPGGDRESAITFLAHVIEAFPQVPSGTDVAGDVTARVLATDTALGRGWACPHAQVDFECDLMCAIGWSPTGVDYARGNGSGETERVSLVAMYLVPISRRHEFLREVSTLAKMIGTADDGERLAQIRELDGVRHYLLDLIGKSKETIGPETRARMIHLQTKAALGARPIADLSGLVIEPITVVTSADGARPVILTQNVELLATLDALPDLGERLERERTFLVGDWRVVRRAAVPYQGGKSAFDCLALYAAR